MGATTDHLSENGWTDPTDDSPIETPDGWYHGSVVHTGGNIYCRTWTDTEAWNPDGEAGDVYHEVAYDDTFRGASVHRYVWNETLGNWDFDGIVAEAEADDQTDVACAELARELMESLDDE